MTNGTTRSNWTTRATPRPAPRRDATGTAARRLSGVLVRTLVLAAVVGLTAVPCTAAPTDRDAAPERSAERSLDLPQIWGAFSGWLDSVWGAHRGYIDPDGHSTTTTTADEDIQDPGAEHRGYIDPDGAN